MESTVKACILASLLSLTSAATPGPDCWFQDKYCDTKDVQFDIFPLQDNLVENDIECYEHCVAENTAVADSCLGFTMTRFRGQDECKILREKCVDNIDDPCLAAGSCISGPANCDTYVASNCGTVPALSTEFVRWQCKDTQGDAMNPYTDDGSPPGTVCTQICPSWKSDDGSIAELFSTCVDDGLGNAAWSETATNDGNTLSYPVLPAEGYPKPDAEEGDSPLSCGCEPLVVKWDPSPDETLTDDTYFYDPNAEAAAEFICTTDIDTNSNTEYIIETPNQCVLYCDEHYVATAKCVDGQWTGNPEFGFWCYQEPTDIAATFF